MYGQTGAGKTHTMDAVTDLVLQQLYAAADDSSNEVSITVSAVELYNEVLRCLLTGRENLQLRWASGAGSFAGVVLEGAEERVGCLALGSGRAGACSAAAVAGCNMLEGAGAFCHQHWAQQRQHDGCSSKRFAAAARHLS